MTEQTYKEATAAIKESGIALPLQKIIQKALDKDFNQEGKWISCQEHYPDKNGFYLVTYDKSQTSGNVDFVGLGEWFGGAWFDDGIKAWQQLPEPYKEEEKC